MTSVLFITLILYFCLLFTLVRRLFGLLHNDKFHKNKPTWEKQFWIAINKRFSCCIKNIRFKHEIFPSFTSESISKTGIIYLYTQSFDWDLHHKYQCNHHLQENHIFWIISCSLSTAH